MKTKKEEIVSAISIGDKAIKLVQAQAKHQGIEVLALDSAAIQAKSEEETAKALQKLLSGRKQKDLGRLVLSIPRNLATIHYVRLPSVKPEEIREMSRLQAAKQIPYDPSEIVLGCQVIRSTPEGYSDVVLVIVHQGIITKYLDLLRKNRLEPREITLDSQGIACWFSLQKALSQETTAVIIDLESEYARLDIFLAGNFVYSRAFNLDISSPSAYKQRLGDEIKRSLLAYEKEHLGKNPQNMFFTGASESLNLIDQGFLAELSLYQPQKYPQERSLNLKSSPKVNTASLSFNSFASLLGLALSQDRLGFNLLPEDIREKRGKAVYKSELRKTMVLSALCIAGISAGGFINLSLRQSRIERFNQHLRGLSADSARIEDMLKKLNILKERMKEKYCLDILAETAEAAGSEINLVSFNYKINKPLTIKGQAKSLSDVFSFVNNLEASDAFKEARLQYSSARKAQSGEIVDFEIVCLIEPS